MEAWHPIFSVLKLFQSLLEALSPNSFFPSCDLLDLAKRNRLRERHTVNELTIRGQTAEISKTAILETFRAFRTLCLRAKLDPDADIRLLPGAFQMYAKEPRVCAAFVSPATLRSMLFTSEALTPKMTWCDFPNAVMLKCIYSAHIPWIPLLTF